MVVTKIKESAKKSLMQVAKARVRKIHLDYIAGLLTIPVLVTAVVINLNNLNANKKPAAAVNSAPSPQVIVVPASSGATTQQNTSSTQSCQKTVGPTVITFPQEGQSIADNPVCLVVTYQDPSYCPVVWSYRVNGGAWSPFSSDQPCLYNLPTGNVTVNLKVDSTASSQQITLTRNFSYAGSQNVPTATPTIVPSATSIPTTSVASSSGQ